MESIANSDLIDALIAISASIAAGYFVYKLIEPILFSRYTPQKISGLTYLTKTTGVTTACATALAIIQPAGIQLVEALTIGLSFIAISGALAFFIGYIKVEPRQLPSYDFDEIRANLIKARDNQPTKLPNSMLIAMKAKLHLT